MIGENRTDTKYASGFWSDVRRAITGAHMERTAAALFITLARPLGFRRGYWKERRI